MDEIRGAAATVQTLDVLEQRAYKKIADLIDGNHLAEASQVAGILKEVGII